jgi:hypothetical protein
MQKPRLALGKYLCGLGASLIILLAGGWLILAPFALGYQPYGADWVSQTTNDFWMGIPIVVVALISFALFFSSLIASLRATGVVLSQPQLPQAPVSYQPQAPAAYQSDLDRTLSTLAAALAADLSARRQASSDQQGDQQLTSRREAQ